MAEATLDVVEMTAEQFAELPEYSLDLPPRAVLGMRWRKNMNVMRAGGKPDWLMGEYTEDVVPNQVRVRWSRIDLRPSARSAPAPASPIAARPRYELERVDAHRYVLHVIREDGMLGGKIGITRSQTLSDARFETVVTTIRTALGATALEAPRS